MLGESQYLRVKWNCTFIFQGGGDRVVASQTAFVITASGGNPLDGAAAVYTDRK